MFYSSSMQQHIVQNCRCRFLSSFLSILYRDGIVCHYCNLSYLFIYLLCYFVSWPYLKSLSEWLEHLADFSDFSLSCFFFPCIVFYHYFDVAVISFTSCSVYSIGMSYLHSPLFFVGEGGDLVTVKGSFIKSIF